VYSKTKNCVIISIIAHCLYKVMSAQLCS